MAVASSSKDSADSEQQSWGRVLIAGGTDFPNLGRKKTINNDHHNTPDLPSPYILRALSNFKITRIFAGHSACHSAFLTLQGDVFVYGRNDKGQCGRPIQPLSKGDLSSGPAVYEPYRLNRTSDFLPALEKGSRGDIIHAAIGRNHTLLVTRGGQVYATGSNANSQIALKTSSETQVFTRIEGAPWTKEGDPVVQVAAGLTFSLYLTTSGKVYASGSCERGQLGNGRTGEHFVSGNRMAFAEENTPILVKGVADKKIVQISCGQQHSIVLDADGFAYVWGFGGYGRLGLGNANDSMTPALVPQFARESINARASSVHAGPTSSCVIDNSRSFWLAGKWKTSGDGGSGQGWTSFRYMQDLMGCKIRKASLGGVTLFVVADENDPSFDPDKIATMNVGWGQSAGNGELALGEGKPKSATAPIRIDPLNGIGLLDVAGGQNTTFFLSQAQGSKYSELPRFPEEVESSDLCLVCGIDKESTDDSVVVLECEKCENAHHTMCLDPPLTEVPEGEWFCKTCEEEGKGNVIKGEAEVSSSSSAKEVKTGKSSKKRQAVEEPDVKTTAPKKGKAAKGKK